MVSRLRRRLRNGFELPATCVGVCEVRGEEPRSPSPPALPQYPGVWASQPPSSSDPRFQVPSPSLPPSESCLDSH